MFALAWPVVAAGWSWMGMGIVDTMMVGRVLRPLGRSASAAFCFSVAIFGMGLLLGGCTGFAAFGPGTFRNAITGSWTSLPEPVSIVTSYGSHLAWHSLMPS